MTNPELISAASTAPQLAASVEGINSSATANTFATNLARSGVNQATNVLGNFLNVGLGLLPIAGIMFGTFYGIDMMTNGLLSGKKRY